jgi:hypothetical protein
MRTQAPGTKDQVDFGCDAHGQSILTLTNPSGTILCASQENQLLATYKITVRFLANMPFSPLHHSIVKIYHPVVFDMIKAACFRPAACLRSISCAPAGSLSSSAPSHLSNPADSSVPSASGSTTTSLLLKSLNPKQTTSQKPKTATCQKSTSKAAKIALHKPRRTLSSLTSSTCRGRGGLGLRSSAILTVDKKIRKNGCL